MSATAPLLLSIDTATLEAGVALWRDGLLGARQHLVTTHSEALLSLIDGVLAAAGAKPRDLDGVVCGAGPGSFTGLRIGLATAKGLCYALGRPLVLVSSLAATAARAPEGAYVCAALDAFKGEVYAARYRIVAGLPVGDGDEEVVAPATLATRLAAAAPLVAVGSGFVRHPELVVPGATLLDARPGPLPADVARLGARAFALGQLAELASAAPRYIRPSEAELLKQHKERA